MNKTVSNTPGCDLHESCIFIVEKSLICYLLQPCVKTTLSVMDVVHGNLNNFTNNAPKKMIETVSKTP